MNDDSDGSPLVASDIAVGVFTSALNLRERALSVQETWLKAFDKGYLIGGWYSDPKLKMISLGSDVGEDYASAHKKQFLGILELYRRFPEAKWFFVTGCDAFIFHRNLLDLLDGYDPDDELLIGGHCGAVMVEGERLIYPAGGPGFALSNALVAALRSVIPPFIGEWEERQPGLKTACDIAMAYIAKRERGVYLTYHEGFYYGPPYYYPNNTFKDGEGNDVNQEVVEKPIAFHNLSIREMYLLESGIWPTSANLFGKAYDKLTRIITRRLKSKTIMNSISRLIFMRRRTSAMMAP